MSAATAAETRSTMAMQMLNKKFLASFWMFSFMVSFVALSYAEVRENGFRFQSEASTQQAEAKTFQCAPETPSLTS